MEDEFEIRIGDEIRDELSLGQPSLIKGKHKAWGHPEQDNVRILFGQHAYDEVNQHAQSDPNCEVGGVLLGRAYGHEGVTYVEITNTIRASLTHAGAAHLTFTTDTWSAVNREQAQRFPDFKIVGWYHTHPRMNVFVSGDDIFLHQHFFPAPWQIALVLEPHKHYGGFFISRDGVIGRASGFYELFDDNDKSIITWHNLVGPTSPPPAFNREWKVPAIITVLAIFIMFFGFLGLQTRSAVNQLETELARMASTVQTVGDQADRIERDIERATAVAQAIAATQEASTRATAQAVAVEKATTTALAATRTVAAQVTATAFSAESTATANAVSATATAVALTVTDQLTSTTIPDVITDTTPAVTSTAVVTSSIIPLSLSSGLAMMYGGQELPRGVTVLRYTPVEFAFTIRNIEAISVTVLHLEIRLQHADRIESVRLIPDVPFDLPPGAEVNYATPFSTAEPGEYVAYVVAQVKDLNDWIEVPAIGDHINRVGFIVQ